MSRTMSHISSQARTAAAILLLFGAMIASPKQSVAQEGAPPPAGAPAAAATGTPSADAPATGKAPATGTPVTGTPLRMPARAPAGTLGAGTPTASSKNPIELTGPANAAALPHYNWDGTLRTDNASEHAPTAKTSGMAMETKPKTALPLFLYDYFEPARRIIEARRAAQRARYTTGIRPPAQGYGSLGGPVSPLNRQQPNGTEPLTPLDQLNPPDQRLQYPPSQYPLTQYPPSEYPPTPNAPSPNLLASPLGAPLSDLEQRDQRKRLLETGEQPADTSRGVVNNDDYGNANGFQGAVDPLTQSLSNLTASIPPSYQLSAGDSLTVRYWSATLPMHEFSTTLDSQGTVILEHGLRAVVRGLTIAQAEGVLRRQLSHLYRNVDVSITLKELRTISVTIGGQAFSPGTYVVPSVATAFNVLYAAGGPTEDGSLRRIEIRRRGRLIGLLDVYKFVTVGAESGDIPLQPGDLIYIPPRVSRVTIDGEVGSPAIFEMAPKETLKDGLHYAGGVKPSAVDQHVQISTVTPGTARILKDVDLRDKQQAGAIPLYDGDSVEVFSVRGTLTNSVTVEGAVDQPGDYALTPGARISDLLRQARGILPEAYPSRADLYRWNPNNTLSLIPLNLDQALAGDPAANLPLVRWDRLKVYTREEVAWTGQRQVTVRGAVQRPGVYYRSGNLHVHDLLLMAGGPTPDAAFDRAVLLHQRGDGTFSYNFIRLGAALQGDAAQDVAIQDNDILAVYRVGDAQFTPTPTVAIRGAVVTPGEYPRGENMKVSDLLKLAGGLLPGAGKRITIAHARHPSSDPALQTINYVPEQGRPLDPQDDLILADGDVVTVQATGGFKDRVELVTIQGAVNSPGPVVLRGDHMRLSEAIRLAGGLRPEAYPEGVEFARSPELIGTAGQRGLAQIISRLSDMINQSAYQREQAKSDIERIKATSVASASSSGPLPVPGTAAPAAQNQAAGLTLANQLARRDLVSPPRVLSDDDLAPSGNVAVNLAKALRRPGGEEDITLMDGDRITVPVMPTTVQVIGAVINARAVLFHSGEKVDYYVANAGGFTPDAARDRIVIIHTGGGLIPADKAGPLRPGDVIVVPTKVVAEKISNSHSNGLDDIFRSITSSAITYRLATSLLGL